jgi:hypothetical protein
MVIVAENHLKELGRETASFGLGGLATRASFRPRGWAADLVAWRRLGAGIVILYPTYGLPDVNAQIDILRRFKEVAGG